MSFSESPLGVAATWSSPAGSAPRPGARADEVKAFIRAGRFYPALGLGELASTEEIRAALEDRWADWSQARAVARGTAANVLDDALQALRFLGTALLNPAGRRTVHLAFSPDGAAAASFPQQDADALRMAWVRLFPDAAAAANAQSRAAMRAWDGGQRAEAAEHARQALALDPFNLSLRSMAEGWLRA